MMILSPVQKICTLFSKQNGNGENCTLLGYYAASSGNSLSMFLGHPIRPIFKFQESKKAMSSSIQETQPLLSVLAPLPADEPIALLQAFHLHATCHGKFVAHILDTSYHL